MKLDPQELIARRMALSLQSYIPNMAEHVENWNKLRADFESLGMLANVATCQKNYEHYKEIADGEYIRLIEGSFAELIPVAGG